jgi:hypothetical protein
LSRRIVKRSDQNRMDSDHQYAWWQNTMESNNFFVHNHRPVCETFTKPDGGAFYWRSDVFELSGNTLYFLLFLDPGFEQTLSKNILQYYNPDKHSQIVLDLTMEAPSMWPLQINMSSDFLRDAKSIQNKVQVKDIFTAFHSVIAQTGIPASKFQFFTANMHVASVYQSWCQKHAVVDQITVKFADYWALDTVQTNQNLYEKYSSSVTGSTRPYYYTTLNNKGRWHRIKLLQHLHQHQLLQKGICSFVFDQKTLDSMRKTDPELAEMLPMSLENTLDHYSKQTVQVDYLDMPVLELDGYMSALTQSYYDIITETITGKCYNNRVFDSFFSDHFWRNMYYTEKTWRSIFYQRPFLLMGNQHQLQMLRDLGFKTFDFLFDESYDNIADADSRLSAMLAENRRVINAHSLSDLHQICNSDTAKHVLTHNRAQMFKFIEKYSYNFKSKVVKPLSEMTWPHSEHFKGFDLSA